jgi:hypothetical protein
MTCVVEARPELSSLTPVSQDPAPTAEARALSHVRALSDLFGRRPDLAGVHPPADLASQAVLWCA